jgi:hypothetical protein
MHFNKMTKTKISSEGYHYLDYAFNPSWVNIMLQEQLADFELKKLAKKFAQKVKKNETIFSRLQHIQQYIHDNTYHISHDDRIKLFGYVSFSSIPYPKSFIFEAFSTIEKAAELFHIAGFKKIWQDDKHLGRCVGSVLGTLEKNITYKKQFRNKVPLQCVEEATIAAAISLLSMDIPRNKIVFLGSPVHICVFIRPMKGLEKGCLFDSKMLYLPKDLKKFGSSPEEKRTNYINRRFGDLWFIVHSTGHANIKKKHILSKKEEQIMKELDTFFGI